MRLIFLLAFLPIASQAQSTVKGIIGKIEFDGDTIESVFRYVANNVRYDTYFKDAPPEYHSYEEVLKDVLEDNKGVCMHYAALFHALCMELGYKSYVVSGYTKYMNQPVGRVPHAWNAVKIKDEWFLFDPTWASGYVIGDTFYPYYEKTWYKLTPDEFIYSHVPFDPVYQFRDQPASHEEIAANNYIGLNEVPMPYDDLLDQFDAAGEEEKLELTLRRTIDAGVTNELIAHKVKFLNEQIKIHRHNRQVYAYSNGVELLKKAKNEYEIYLTAKQRFFKDWTEEDITSFLESFSYKTRIAHGQLSALKVVDKTLEQSIKQNMLYTSEMLVSIEREEQFVHKYLKTWKPLRILSFL